MTLNHSFYTNFSFLISLKVTPQFNSFKKKKNLDTMCVLIGQKWLLSTVQSSVIEEIVPIKWAHTFIILPFSNADRPSCSARAWKKKKNNYYWSNNPKCQNHYQWNQTHNIIVEITPQWEIKWLIIRTSVVVQS